MPLGIWGKGKKHRETGHVPNGTRETTQNHKENHEETATPNSNYN